MLCAVGALQILIGFNKKHGIAVGCGLCILGALFGASISARQVLLHILPNDPGFASTLLGLHLYTWGLIAYIAQIAASGIMLIASSYVNENIPVSNSLIKASSFAVLTVVIANILSAFAESGLKWEIPDTPLKYLLFS